MKLTLLVLFGSVAASYAFPAEAQLLGERRATCISTAAPITARGVLTMRHFAGPPNYENIRGGDEDDLVLILTLPEPACIDDPDFDTSHRPFRTVHVWTSDERLRAKLHRFVGRIASVSGDGYGAHTAHHRAPLVLEAKSVDEP